MHSRLEITVDSAVAIRTWKCSFELSTGAYGRKAVFQRLPMIGSIH